MAYGQVGGVIPATVQANGGEMSVRGGVAQVAPAAAAPAPAPYRAQRMVPTDMATTGLRSQRSRDVAAQINAGRAQRRAEIAAAQPAMADGGMVVGKSCEQTGFVGSLHGKNMKK